MPLRHTEEKPMNIRETLRDQYNIGPVTSIHDTSKSNPSSLVVTTSGKYILKQVGRADFVEIYNKVQAVLTDHGFPHGKVVPTKDGSLMTPDGFALFTYMPGDALEEDYSDEEFRSAVAFLRRYNEALKKVPFAPGELATVNNWDRVRSVQFMLNSIGPIINQCSLGDGDKALLRMAARVLTENSDFLRFAPKQLVHADPAGNIIFVDGVARATIDFTPDCDHELYSLAQFLYWTCLWRSEGSCASERVAQALKTYNDSDSESQEYSMEILHLYLVKAAMARMVGSTLEMLEGGTFHPDRVCGRLSALEVALSQQKATGKEQGSY